MTTSHQKTKLIQVDKVTSGVLYTSDFCELKNWAYDFNRDDKPSKRYNDCLCVVYVKKGNFLFDLSKDSYDLHSGHIVIDKPDYEYCLRPSIGECTIFNFTNDFYSQFIDDFNLKYSFFFSNQNILSLMLRATPETEYLHFQLMQKIGKAGKLDNQPRRCRCFANADSCPPLPEAGSKHQTALDCSPPV